MPLIFEMVRDRPMLLWITNSKSHMANRSVSIPMTMNDLGRRDVMAHFFLADLSTYTLPFDTERPNLAC